MPTLKQLTCEIEWGNKKIPFPEYGTTYGDGVVETYIAIPDHAQPFAVHLTSNGYIAEGLAMMVFMDGEYQCNRNRLNLKPPRPGISSRMTNMELRVRQKEKPLGRGTYLGRSWRFDKHNVVSLDQLPSNVDRQHFDKLGTISIIILRCRAKDQIGILSTTSSDVDDSGLLSPDSTKETPEATPGPASHEGGEPKLDEPEPDFLFGIMNDGTVDTHQFGLDGEGPGPTEQRVWSWTAQQPSSAGAHGQLWGHLPGQLPPTHSQQYGNYGQPPGFPQPGPGGPTVGQGQPATQRPQRHVHFNDQIPHQPPGYGVSRPDFTGPSFNASAGQSSQQLYPQQPSSSGASGPGFTGPSFGENGGQSHQQQYPQQPASSGASGPGFTGPSFNASAGQSSQQQYSHQPPDYGASGRGSTGQSFGENSGQPSQQQYYYPQQPGSYLPIPTSHYAQPGPGSSTAAHGYVNAAWPQGGMVTPQDYGRPFLVSTEPPGYPPQMSSHQPIGYGVPSYPSWPSAMHHPAWPGQPMAGANYWTLPNVAPSFQPSYPYPYSYPQPTATGGPGATEPRTVNANPGGGIWGPPPPPVGSQDPAKDENNQLDGQSSQNQVGNDNAAAQSDNNNNQEWNNDDTNNTQSGNSGWNTNDSGGGPSDSWNTNGGGPSDNNTTGGDQNDSWNSTATQTEATATDWNQSTANTGQTNNAEPWNGNTNTGTQAQDSWNADPALSVQNPDTFAIPHQTPHPLRSTGQGKPLYGPHGPYHDTLATSADGEVQPIAGEEPPYDVPADMQTTHQVKPGAGYMYVHKRRSPEYIDTLEEPYAHFIFKYRTREQIEKESGIRVDDEATGDEEKRKLQVMDKDEIIEMLLKAKMGLGGRIPSPPATHPSKPSIIGETAAAVPAPTHNFLDYSVPNGRHTAYSVPSVAGNAGLGLSLPGGPGPAVAPTTTQDWAGNHDWGNTSNVGATAAPPAPGTAPGQQLSQTTDTWAAPPASTQPAATAAQPPLPPHHQPSQGPAQTPHPWTQPHAVEPPPQTQQQQQQQQPPIAPLQLNRNVQTYQPAGNNGGDNGRPVSPPNGGWNAHAAPPSSTMSDNGKGGWDVGGGGGGGATATAAQPAGGAFW